MPLEQGPKRLASLEVPGLRVEIIAFDDVFVRQVPEAVLSYACREEEVPQLEAIQIDDQSAILIRNTDASSMQLFMRIGDAYYMVVGQVPLNDLLQLATSIAYSQL